MPDRGQPLALYRQKKLGHCWPDAAGIFLRPFIDQSQAHALLALHRGRTVGASAGLVEGWRPEEDDGIGLGTSGWVGWWGRVPCAWKQSCHPNPTQRMQFSSERGGSFHVLCALDLTRSSNGRQLTCHRLPAPHVRTCRGLCPVPMWVWLVCPTLANRPACWCAQRTSLASVISSPHTTQQPNQHAEMVLRFGTVKARHDPRSRHKSGAVWMDVPVQKQMPT